VEADVDAVGVGIPTVSVYDHNYLILDNQLCWFLDTAFVRRFEASFGWRYCIRAAFCHGRTSLVLTAGRIGRAVVEDAV
jgi:hypothetical protein